MSSDRGKQKGNKKTAEGRDRRMTAGKEKDMSGFQDVFERIEVKYLLSRDQYLELRKRLEGYKIKPSVNHGSSLPGWFTTTGQRGPSKASRREPQDSTHEIEDSRR